MSLRQDVRLPETVDLCKGSLLLRDLDEETLEELAEKTIEQALAPDEVVFRQGDAGDAMYVIGRGAIRLSRMGPDGEDRELDVLMTGEVFGEMALLGGRTRNATATALTGAVVGRVSRRDFAQLMETRPEVKRRVFAVFARHALDDRIRVHPKLAHVDREAARRWMAGHEVIAAHQLPIDAAWTLVLRGAVTQEQTTIAGPALVETGAGGWIGDGDLVLLPRAPLDLHRAARR